MGERRGRERASTGEGQILLPGVLYLILYITYLIFVKSFSDFRPLRFLTSSSKGRVNQSSILRWPQRFPSCIGRGTKQILLLTIIQGGGFFFKLFLLQQTRKKNIPKNLSMLVPQNVARNVPVNKLFAQTFWLGGLDQNQNGMQGRQK